MAALKLLMKWLCRLVPARQALRSLTAGRDSGCSTTMSKNWPMRALPTLSQAMSSKRLRHSASCLGPAACRRVGDIQGLPKV